MHDPDETAATGAEIDPDAVLWVHGVDYVSGWREARDAAAELVDALTAAGLEVTHARVRADAAPDGSGVLRMECSAAMALEVAMLVRVTAARLGRAS